MGGGPQNTKQRFIMMVEVVALLEQERAKAPNERFYAQRPPYPLRILSKLYQERYDSRTFTQYDGRRGNVVEQVSLLTPSIPTQRTRTCVFERF